MENLKAHSPKHLPNEGPKYEGGCHCGAVRFEVMVQDHQAIACNCSICIKKGFLHYIVPEEDFILKQGESALAEYRFNTQTAQHLFCSFCGIHAFYRPRSHPNCWDVNLNCLDAAMTPGFFDQFNIQPFDGQAWEDNIHTLKHDDTVATTD